MKKRGLKHSFWIFANLWGWALGRPILAPLHRVFLNLSLHALGHDNPHFTGEERFIRKILKKNDIQVCIDIGANIGNYSAELVHSLKCVVYAFEPLSSSFEHLQSRGDEFPNSLIPLRIALADFTGKAVIRAKGPLSETATLSSEGEKFDTVQEEVSVTTLDAFVKEKSLERIDFIKIDTEGFEREVLIGMQDTLAALKPKFIQFEFNLIQLQRGYTLYTLSQLLSGYTLYRLLPHGWIRIEPSSFSANIFIFQNIVAVRK